jgi:S-adenosylmethionine:diacylglycerol 3-amino-3-carboxypropyl transferase
MDRMKATLEQNEEEEATKMEAKPKNERKKIVNISSGGRLMLS